MKKVLLLCMLELIDLLNVYSYGINRIALTLKHQAIDKYNTFIGIIWSGTPMQEKSFQSSTAYE
jgi:hypothetical protein